MADSIQVDGKELFSSKRASEISGYAQDYIGQLARGGHIHAQRVGGLWYVSVDSLQAYQSESEKAKREVQIPQQEKQDLDTLVSFDGKEYVSATHGAKVTGYHQDYVGQLARSGKILSKQVGNRWYVDKKALLSHKEEKDALLAAVQSQSVGIVKPNQATHEAYAHAVDHSEPYYSYISSAGSAQTPLIPPISGQESAQEHRDIPHKESAVSIPIRVAERAQTRTVAQNKDIYRYESHNISLKKPKNRLPSVAVIGTGLLVLATIVLVIAVGNPIGKLPGSFAKGSSSLERSLPASAAFGAGNAILKGFTRVGDLLEGVIAPEISYKRR